MKTYVYFLFLSLAFFSCKDKEVDLLPIDILTGGSTKDWYIETFQINDDFFEPEDLFMTNEITFEKRYKEDKSYEGTYYVWHSLQGESQNLTFKVQKFTKEELHLHEVFQDETTNPTPSVWKVNMVSNDNIILSQRTVDERKTIEVNGEEVPNPTFGQATTQTITLVHVELGDIDIDIDL